MAAFLVGLERDFKGVREGVFWGIDFMRIYTAGRQNVAM
jgi:hypothetical protein